MNVNSHLRSPRHSSARGVISQALGVFLCGLLAMPARAGEADSNHFLDWSIEQLMNESVTSVAKKETKLSQSPAAIAVVTQEDIRRLGITSLPEALRWVPGMNVGRMSEGVSGIHLARQLRAELPTLRVVFTSGYSCDLLGEDAKETAAECFLQKPYRPDKLARTVRECLDAPANPPDLPAESAA